MSPAAGARGADSLTLRVLSALVGLPLVLGAVWLGGPALLILGAAVAVAGLWELRYLVASVGSLSLTVAGLGTLAFLLSAWRGEPLAPVAVVSLIVGALLWHLGRHLARPETGPGLAGWSLTVLGAFYPGGLLSYGLLLRGLEQGREWLLLALLVTFASDTGGYLTGRALGRHRMAPRMSPGKTWEGAAGALLTAGVAGGALALAFRLPLGPGAALAAGMGLSVLAQAGDLAESWLKRAAGVKESGRLVPGHGGILDRLDSVVLVLPAAYYGVVWAT